MNKKLEILKYINDFSKDNGYMPSIREICKEFGMTSTSSAFYYLKKLENEGLIAKASGKNRAIKINNKDYTTNANTFNVLGNVAAGKPIFALENIEEQMELPPELFGINNGDMFMLTVAGDSMINAGIFNGDKIVVKKQQTAENGEIVVAMVENQITVKRFFKEDKKIRLQPENDFMSPIIVSNCEIIGTVTGLVRQKIK